MAEDREPESGIFLRNLKHSLVSRHRELSLVWIYEEFLEIVVVIQVDAPSAARFHNVLKWIHQIGILALLWIGLHNVPNRAEDKNGYGAMRRLRR